MKRAVTLLALLVLGAPASLLAAPGGLLTATASAATLRGVGTRVVTLLQSEQAASFRQATGNRVPYTVTGPDLALSDVTLGLAGFAAVDAPLSPVQAAACPACREIPRDVTAVGIGYHLPGIGNGLNLSGPVLAGIYLGQITSWSDPRIGRLNPHRKLPNLKITPLFSAGASDETYVLSTYLSAISRRWRRQIGAGTQVAFPAGTAEAGNAGIGRMIRETAGAVGYMTTPYLFTQPRISEARVQNAAGNFEYPSTDSVFDAAKPVRRIPPRGASIVNPPKVRRQAYPIATFTSSLVLAHPAHAWLLRRWLTFCITTARYDAMGTGFSPLPPAPLRAAQARIKSL